MTRLLGVDPGEARIGLAICDEEERIAVPVTVIERKGRSLAWVAQMIAMYAQQNGAAEVVIGLALNGDGSEGEQARKARSLGRRIAQVADLRLHYWDERMSSFIAEQHVLPASAGRRRRPGPRDDLAAAVILQSYIERDADTQSRAETRCDGRRTTQFSGPASDTIGTNSELS